MAKTGGGRSKWGKASGKGPDGSSPSSPSSSTTTSSSPTRRLKKGGKRGRRLCHKEGCTLCPSFGFEGDVAVSCSHHKEEGMRNLTARRCQHEGCFTVANFGMPGDKPGFCAAHSTEGMVNRNKPRGGEGMLMTVARSSRRTAKTSSNSNSEASGMLEAAAVAAAEAASEASPGIRSQPPSGGKDLLMRAATARARMEVALGVNEGDRYGAPAPSRAMTMGGRGRLQESDDLDIKDESSLARLVNGRSPVLVRRGCAARGKGMGGVSHKRSLASMSIPMAMSLSVPMSPSSGSGSACGSPAAMFISRGEGMIDSFSAGSPSSSPLSKREDSNKFEVTGRGGRVVSLSRSTHGNNFGAATVLRPPSSSSASSRQHQHDCFDEFNRTVSNVCGTMGSRMGGGTGGHAVVPVGGSSSSISRGGVGKAPLNLDFSGDFRGGELMEESFCFMDGDCCLERNGHVDDMHLGMEMGATLDDILGVDEDDEDEASLAGRGVGRCFDSSPVHSGLRTSSANGATLYSRGGSGLTDLSCVDASSEPVDSVIGVGDGGSNGNGNNDVAAMDFELDHLPELTSVDLSGLNTHTGDSACASGRDLRRQQQQNRGSACSLRIGSNGNGDCYVNGIRNVNGSSNTPTSTKSTGAVGSPVAAAAAAAVAAVRSTPSGASTPAPPPPPGPTGSPADTQTNALVLPKPPGDEEWWDVLEGEDFMAMPDSIWDTQHSQHLDAADFVEDSDGRRSGGGGDGFSMIPGDGCSGVVGVGAASSVNKNKNSNAGGLSHEPAKRRRQTSLGLGDHHQDHQHHHHHHHHHAVPSLFSTSHSGSINIRPANNNININITKRDLVPSGFGLTVVPSSSSNGHSSSPLTSAPSMTSGALMTNGGSMGIGAGGGGGLLRASSGGMGIGMGAGVSQQGGVMSNGLGWGWGITNGGGGGGGDASWINGGDVISPSKLQSLSPTKFASSSPSSSAHPLHSHQSTPPWGANALCPHQQTQAQAAGRA